VPPRKKKTRAARKVLLHVHTGANTPVTQLPDILVQSTVVGEGSEPASGKEGDTFTSTLHLATMAQQVKTPRERGFRAKNLRIPEFNSEGATAVEHWLNAIDLAVQADECELDAPWPQRPLYFAVGASLRGNAATWFLDHNSRVTNTERTFDRLSELLRAQYGSRETVESVTSRLNRRSQEPGETFAEYAVALRKLSDKVHVPQATLVHSFLEGLSSDAVHFVRGPTFRTLEGAVEHAEKVFNREWTEDFARSAKKRNVGERPRITGRMATTTSPVVAVPPILSVNLESEFNEANILEEGEVAPVRTIQQWGGQGGPTSFAPFAPAPTAYPFHQSAQYQPQYPIPMPYYPYPPQYQPMQWHPPVNTPVNGRKRAIEVSTDGRPNKSTRSDMACWHCLQTGHYRRDCPSQQRGEPPTPRTGPESSYPTASVGSQQLTPSSN
jgi:hypothetical protein